MRYVCDRKNIGLSEVEIELERLGSLLNILNEYYFSFSQEFAEKHPRLLAIEYTRFSDLANVCRFTLQDVQDTLNIAKENYVCTT